MAYRGPYGGIVGTLKIIYHLIYCVYYFIPVYFVYELFTRKKGLDMARESHLASLTK
jgi:hypothetical protein